MAACTTSVPSASAVAPVPDPTAPAAPEGLELVRLRDDLDLRESVETFGTSVPMPGGSVFVHVVDDGNDDEELLAPVHAPAGQILLWGSATDDAGQPLLEAATLDCPTGELTVPALSELGASAPLCLGSGSFEFGAFLPGVCGVADGPLVSGEPDWLNGHAPGVMLFGERVPQDRAFEVPANGAVYARLAPGVSFLNCDADLADRFYLVTAHFDDPAATDCRTQWSGMNGIVDEEPEVSIARCRLAMVITATQPLPGR